MKEAFKITTGAVLGIAAAWLLLSGLGQTSVQLFITESPVQRSATVTTATAEPPPPRQEGMLTSDESFQKGGVSTVSSDPLSLRNILQLEAEDFLLLLLSFAAASAVGAVAYVYTRRLSG